MSWNSLSPRSECDVFKDSVTVCHSSGCSWKRKTLNRRVRHSCTWGRLLQITVKAICPCQQPVERVAGWRQHCSVVTSFAPLLIAIVEPHKHYNRFINAVHAPRMAAREELVKIKEQSTMKIFLRASVVKQIWVIGFKSYMRYCHSRHF